MSTLKEYFADWDPMRFISEGAARDEYDQEADEISAKFRSDMNDAELAVLVHQTFVDSMEIDPEGFVDDCSRRAPEIRKALTH